MIKEVNGMRLKIEGDLLVVGPMTKEGAIFGSAKLIDPPSVEKISTPHPHPYPDSWSHWRYNLEQMFGIEILDLYEIVTIKYLYDLTLVVAEFRRVATRVAP